MKYREDYDFVRNGHANFVDDDVWQSADDPFMSVRNATDPAHARELCQLFSGQSNTRGDLLPPGCDPRCSCKLPQYVPALLRYSAAS